MIIPEIKYINPWYSSGGLSPQIYKRLNISAYKSECGRGMILSYLPNHYDYLVNGKVVTQRVGKSVGLLNQAIAFLLDGGPGFMYADRMKEAYNK